MILVLLLVVVLGAAAAAGLLGFGALSGDRRRERSGGLLAALSAPVVLVVGLALAAAVVVGLGGERSDDAEPDRPRVGPSVTRAPRSLPSARVETALTGLPIITLRAAEEDTFAPYLPISGLAPGSVVRVQAEGFAWLDHGRVEQCVSELGRQTACSTAFPVQFDDDGRADFQFAVRGDIAPGGCRLREATCLLRLTGTKSGRSAQVQTVLVDRLVPGEVRVEPAQRVADGQAVEVSVTGFPAGATATAVLCAPPEAYDARRCSTAEPASTFTVDAAGTGRTSLVVVAGRAGADAMLCGPRRPCGIAVVVGPGFVAAPVAPVRFSLGPGVSYDAARVATGVVVALLLVGAAVVLARRTDWTKPTEAATPELDRADLRADQNLDDLFGTEEELDARDPIPW